jgi:hypothetical protein
MNVRALFRAATVEAASPPYNTIHLPDFPATQPEAELRNLMTEAIGLFIDAHVYFQTTALEALNQLLASNYPLIASLERK